MRSACKPLPVDGDGLYVCPLAVRDRPLHGDPARCVASGRIGHLLPSSAAAIGATSIQPPRSARRSRRVGLRAALRVAVEFVRDRPRRHDRAANAIEATGTQLGCAPQERFDRAGFPERSAR